ncbi:transcriptional regulator with XRE-family HTH domain [Actinoplanes couchii]|nr:transcriptional regulator with XRE-family HTH domain [Actinoplanes couchii]
MAKRTGFSRSYLGNVETGERAPTQAVVEAYERVLGDDVRRRLLLLGTVVTAAGPSAPAAADAGIGQAAAIAMDIRHGRSELLQHVQTTHTVDRTIAGLAARNAGSSAALVKWSRKGAAVLRVNSAGILAKTGSPTLDNEVVRVLSTDGEVRELYLTAVLSRVLGLPWEAAAKMATTGAGAASTDHLDLLTKELENPADAGARWCSILLLHRSRQDNEPVVTASLLRSLRTEPSREALRAVGAALAGEDPLTILRRRS